MLSAYEITTQVVLLWIQLFSKFIEISKQGLFKRTNELHAINYKYEITIHAKMSH